MPIADARKQTEFLSSRSTHKHKLCSGTYGHVFLLGKGACFLSMDRKITIMNPFTNRRVNIETWSRISKSHLKEIAIRPQGTSPLTLLLAGAMSPWYHYLRGLSERESARSARESIMVQKHIFDIASEVSRLQILAYQHRFLLASATSSSLAKIMSISKKNPWCLSQQVNFLILKHTRRLDGIVGTQPIPNCPNPIQHKFHISERPSIPQSTSTQPDGLTECVQCTGESESCTRITSNFLQTSILKRSNAPTQRTDKKPIFSNQVIYIYKNIMYNTKHNMSHRPIAYQKSTMVHSSFLVPS